MSVLICKNERRREKVRQHQQLNGIDYLEVGTDQTHLTVYFLGKAPVEIEESNILIEGGRRIRDIRAIEVEVHRFDQIEFDDYMDVVVDQAGDFSNYTLRLVERDEAGQYVPHSAFDPRYDRIDFSFKVDCPSDLDCKTVVDCPPQAEQEPEINYLAKDYSSFRQLILDRLALIMPDWKERHVPDMGITLVEILAYTGDHLSYYQDAVATEAYLGTARRRISVRRHARLVDYPMHEGCNARTWICLQTDYDVLLPASADIFFTTQLADVMPNAKNVLAAADLEQIPASAYEVFEPLKRRDIPLYRDHNRLHFYTWGDQECCLAEGATSATLAGGLAYDKPQFSETQQEEEQTETKLQEIATSQELSVIVAPRSAQIHLIPGDVLIFEEVTGPKTGHPGDADPTHRHAVRLTRVEGGYDPLNQQPVVEISWAQEDALPFPLCISALGPPPDCKILENVSIACGNVILVDHGKTVREDLDAVPTAETLDCCKGPGKLADTISIPGRHFPELKYVPLTFSEPLLSDTPASHALLQDTRHAQPQIVLKENDALPDDQPWFPRRDLLASSSTDQHFVAETDDEGRAHLRFGNGETGFRPPAGATFQATYRIGNGPAGNVGNDTITHLILQNFQLDGAVITVRNPLTAQGGSTPEPISEVKLFAPHTFRKTLQRAITADDYAAIVQREFKDQVQRAAAQLCWMGSWYEMLVTVDPYGQEAAGPELLCEIRQCLRQYRRIGHDLNVQAAQRVPLDIEMMVCVLPDFLRGHVKAELLQRFSNRLLTNGQRGFFHADNLTFGDDIYLSRLVAVAQAVPGVESVKLITMQRLNELPNQEIENGVLPLGPFEIARLDNDPGFPENGKLTLDMRGGR